MRASYKASGIIGHPVQESALREVIVIDNLLLLDNWAREIPLMSIDAVTVIERKHPCPKT
jgi:hypothetical protein